MPNPIREYLSPAFTLGEDWDTVHPSLKALAEEYAPFIRAIHNTDGVLVNVEYDTDAFNAAKAKWDAAEQERYAAELAAEEAAAAAPPWEPPEAVTDPLTARIEDVENAIIELAEIVAGGEL
ncbi:MAG: hypothetical protein LBN00_09980 [Oscillospiraceae bacterium]|jgi:hypothetical protein|nr:hypothetical protein [Oscillospiraceae bacterium]